VRSPGTTAAFLASLALLGAACSSTTEATPTTSVTPETTVAAPTAAPTTAAPTTTIAPGEPVDRLLIVDPAGNIITTDRSGESIESITEDAGPGAGYFQPTWSPNADSIVVSRFSDGAFTLVNFDVDAGTQSSVPTDNNAFYVYWSPRGDRVGYLSTGSEGMGLSIAEFGDDPSSNRVEMGAPFYFSWDPAGEGVAALIGQQRLELLDTAGGPPAAIANPGAFLNPAWTDAGLLYVIEIAGTDALVLGNPGDDFEVLARSNGMATFTAPASGDRVAVQSIGQPTGISAAYQSAPLLPLNQLVVVERATGAVEVVTEQPALAFFWDGAGEQLLVLDTNSDTGLFRWSVWADGELRRLADFLPARVYVETFLPFFSQYALSTTMWSPDGTAFAFAGNIDGVGGIYVQEVAGGAAVKVADGGWVSWSPR
jgi:hypothetical protein